MPPDEVNLPPGKMGFPLIGETLQFLFDPDFIAKHCDRYGLIFKSHIFGQPTVFVAEPEAVRFVLSSPVNQFSWHEGVPKQFRILLGDALSIQDGEQHRQNRQLIMPGLHDQALASYIQTMEIITLKYLAKWERYRFFAWFDEFKQLTFEIASQILLGVSPGVQVKDLSQLFTTLINGTFALIPSRLAWTRFGQALAAREKLRQHLLNVIYQRQEHPNYDVLSLLIQARVQQGNGMNLDELMDQVLLLLAGHEKTTSMLTWLCLELTRHPEMFNKAREEQRQLAQPKPLDLEQIGRMTYLDQVLRETERLHPPISGSFLGVVKPFEFKGFYVPAGWRVYYSIVATHQNTSIYPEPERFDSERFSPEQAAKYPPYSLIGFGGELRTCLGMAFAKLQMKIIIAHLLRGYRWELLPKQSFDPVRVPSSRPKDGLRVQFLPPICGHINP